MKSMVVLFALAAVACGSLVPAQPPHHPALVLDPHGRPLDTAEVINARAQHLQAKALEGHYAPLAHAAVVAPYAHSVVAPAVYAAPAAVSHQSRVDVHSSPAIVINARALHLQAKALEGHYAPLAHAAVVAPYAHSVVAPAVYAAPAAVSHQSRVDVHSSPAIVSHAVAAPVLAHAAPVVAHSAYAAPLLAHSALGYAGHGHYLKKRSLGHLAYAAPVVAHVAPSAVSHQSRGALLQVVSVAGVAESGVSQQGSGVGGVRYDGSGVGEHGSGDGVAHDGGAAVHIHTGLVGHGGGRGVHGGRDHGVGVGRDDGSVREGSVVALQGLSLQVQGAGVDHLGGVQRAAVRVQHERRVVRGLRRHQGAARHGGKGE
ncbi:unnamed protein product [Chrysodeixis includens]|uniref:Cuticle protein n=1 Tax=Chrysodeixis includens TaxID=689277 RepID=A0A9N8Q075_CHRIL|nr:unnamed protein product [Chrysodeixis includens]